ncbi:MAG: T9SS type A sorting domain-containing protein [Candidatus Cloacimonetes bacterium]|nr:T9SS type A sorting domain-containing protein [Candidatus Cloacimonadota bacterium]
MKKLAILVMVMFVASLCYGQNAWLNELHYDNFGTDVGEFLEIVIENPGSYTLSDFTVSLYNGNGGAVYGSETLDNFTIGNTSGNYTFYTWYPSSIQNGAPDGLSLDYQGTVIQFLSYEGTLTATDGPANGLTSTDIGVSEPGEIGESLQLSGTGTQYSEFFWVEPAPETPGALNNSQSFGTASAVILKAYAIGTEDMDVKYSMEMTSVSVGDYELTGTATITFTAATIDGTDPTWVHLTDASQSMIGDLTLDTITDTENNTDYEFYAGVTPIALTNTLYPSDGHIENGILATFDATVTANDAYNNVWVSDFDGAYNGVLIFDYDFDAYVAVDDQVLFVAERTEYNNLTELKYPVLINSYGGFPITPSTIPGSNIDMTIPADTNPAEQWEGQLVVIENVVVAAIVKDDLYIGSNDGWTTTFVIGDNVDYGYSATATALNAAVASGNPVDIVGVVDWSTYDLYYRINPRDENDITPSGGNPSVIKAWALGVDEMDVLYDLDMTSASPGWYYLTGTATITFDTVEIDGDEPQIVHLSGASQDMIGDLVLDNIYDSNSDTDYDFYAGITPIALTNTNNPSKGHIQNDRVATFSATVTANDEYSDVWVSDDTGAYNGVHVFDYDFVDFVSVSDDLLFYATRDEYNNKTELVDPVLLDSGTGEEVTPTTIAGLNIDWTIPANTDPAEMWEGQLIKIENAVIQGIDTDAYVGSDDSGTTIFVIGDAVDYNYAVTGTLLDSAVASGDPYDIIGVVDWNYTDAYYRINPRDASDIISNVSVDPTPGNELFIQNHPNPFTGSTTISFSLPHNAAGEINIYNMHGQLVRTLTPEDQSATWNGLDETGRNVANGIYFYTLDTGKEILTKKMILMR